MSEQTASEMGKQTWWLWAFADSQRQADVLFADETKKSEQRDGANKNYTWEVIKDHRYFLIFTLSMFNDIYQNINNIV